MPLAEAYVFDMNQITVDFSIGALIGMLVPGAAARKVIRDAERNRIKSAGKISSKAIKSGSTTYKNSSDITKDIRKNKPLNSPAVDSWYGKNGIISIDKNGVWTYHDWEGNSVSYPNFKSAGMVRQEAPIGPFVERSKDFAKAREMGYIKSADGTWHHHEDGVTLQEVETILHDRFRHRGGISNLKKK